jgi:hypothetical protein
MSTQPEANTIVDSTNAEHIALVNVLVKNVFDCMGLTIESNVLSSMTSVVLFAIKQRFRGVTFEDVQNALQIGLGGAYGEVFKVNAPVLCSWIEHYWQETANERIAKRAAENKANGAKAIAAHSTMTEEERFRHNKALTNDLYQSFCKGDRNRLVKLYDIAYDYLCQTGALRPTQEQWNAAYRQAAAEVAHNGGHAETNIFRQQVENTTHEQSTIIKAKQIIVLQCFAEKQKQTLKNS